MRDYQDIRGKKGNPTDREHRSQGQDPLPGSADCDRPETTDKGGRTADQEEHRTPEMETQICRHQGDGNADQQLREIVAHLLRDTNGSRRPVEEV